MHYYIDGYNLLFRSSSQKKNFEEARDEIIAFLKEAPLSLTVIFDGGGDDSPIRTHKGSLEIVYTPKGQSADDYILQELSWVKHPKEYSVVTSDKKLAAACRYAGSSTKTVAAFLTFLSKKQAPQPKEKPGRESDKNFQRLLKAFTERSRYT